MSCHILELCDSAHLYEFGYLYATDTVRGGVVPAWIIVGGLVEYFI